MNACLEDATHQDQNLVLDFLYKEIVECFFFASFDIMPNLSYVMGIKAKYNNRPKQTPCNIVSRIMKYLSGHKTLPQCSMLITTFTPCRHIVIWTIKRQHWWLQFTHLNFSFCEWWSYHMGELKTTMHGQQHNWIWIHCRFHYYKGNCVVEVITKKIGFP